jgi:hypothetical protein
VIDANGHLAVEERLKAPRSNTSRWRTSSGCTSSAAVAMGAARRMTGTLHAVPARNEDDLEDVFGEVAALRVGA